MFFKFFSRGFYRKPCSYKFEQLSIKWHIWQAKLLHKIKNIQKQALQYLHEGFEKDRIELLQTQKYNDNSKTYVSMYRKL